MGEKIFIKRFGFNEPSSGLCNVDFKGWENNYRCVIRYKKPSQRVYIKENHVRVQSFD